MNLSRDVLLRLADASGFREVTLEKVIRLSEVLGDIARHPLLASALVLKGGTWLSRK